MFNILQNIYFRRTQYNLNNKLHLVKFSLQKRNFYVKNIHIKQKQLIIFTPLTY